MKTRAELRFRNKNYGRSYALLFRMALILNASARLGLLAAMGLFARVLGVGVRYGLAMAEVERHTRNASDVSWYCDRAVGFDHSVIS
jgi:hypothetical protein